MTQGRINHDYLSQLFTVAREQDETELIPHLFRTLQSENEIFLREPVTTSASPEARKTQQARVHRLKNVYFNLGCEQVGHILEEMYQALKTDGDADRRLPSLWDDFKRESQLTMNQLSEEISAFTH